MVRGDKEGNPRPSSYTRQNIHEKLSSSEDLLDSEKELHYTERERE